MNYRIEDCTLHTEKRSLTYSSPITDSFTLGDKIIIRLKLMGKADNKNNVYAISEGWHVWQVQDFAQYHPRYAVPPYNMHPGAYAMINIYKKDPSLILGTTTGGFRYLIDPADGKIVGEESWVK